MQLLLQWKCNNMLYLLLRVRVTVNNVILLCAAQKYFYGEFISPVTIEHAEVIV
jgi:hypothetical protein